MVRITLLPAFLVFSILMNQANANNYCGPSAEAALSEISSVFSRHLGSSEITATLRTDILNSTDTVKSLYLNANMEFAEAVGGRGLHVSDIANDACTEWISKLSGFSAFMGALRFRLQENVYGEGESQEFEILVFNEYLGEVLKGFREL